MSGKWGKLGYRKPWDFCGGPGREKEEEKEDRVRGGGVRMLERILDCGGRNLTRTFALADEHYALVKGIM